MKKLLFYVIITIIIGSIPTFFIKISKIYNTLIKPPLSPPGILFPIVWTILFILMGISIYLVVISNNENISEARLIYFVQLILNALWTPIFFGFNQYFLGFLWILMLIILVVSMILIFYKINNVSAYLNIPYLIWLLFACYLSFGVYILN